MGIGHLIKKNITNPSEIRANFERLAVSVQSTINPNHRHDEAWEQELDAQREAVCASHRMRSFAPKRDGNAVKWYSDGCDYFWALSEILDKAQSHVFILDWWLTPELYLRRPAHLFESYRLDRILKRKAEQGVRIFIVVYKEVTQTMTMSSSWTKHYLEDLHPNIQVYRHPDHLGGEVTLMWSHHEKLVVVDNTWACVGGLDICDGRWDTHSHPLSDVHLTDYNRTLFVGQDYNNARIEDFHNVKDYLSNNQSRAVIGRMPWHDVHVMIHGPAVLDVASHFIQRWSFLKTFKYKSEKRMPYIALPVGADESPELVDPQFAFLEGHPHLVKMAKQGERFKHPFHAHHRTEFIASEGSAPATAGTAKVQVLRSSADWSLGILTEHSIQNAYIEMIMQAEHCIYIENQFFITSTQEDGVVKNRVGAALVGRIIKAHQEGAKFKVIVIIPTIPCFAGELDKAAGIRAIMAYQYLSISRGEDSIFGQLRSAGVDANDYISFYHLRGYDRINYSQELVKKIESLSGVTYHQSQVALARVFNGDAKDDLGVDEKGHSKGPLHSSSVKIYNPDEPNPKSGNAPPFSGTPATIEEVSMPATVAEAEAILERFQSAARQVLDPRVKDTVADDILTAEPKPSEEVWQTSPKEEVGLWVTEETYIHSKLMIVDDRRVLIGSANLNERSQRGDRDSEIAVIVEDEEMFDSTMNGKPYRASKFATSFRRHLWRQHLGLIPPQLVTPEAAQHFPTAGMMPAPAPNPDPSAPQTTEREHEALVSDPLGEDVERLWKECATTNTRAYDDVFHPVPSDRVASWKAYHAFFPKPPIVTGHVADPDADPKWVRERLSTVRGSLVNFAHHFLSEEDLITTDVEVNHLTLDIYL